MKRTSLFVAMATMFFMASCTDETTVFSDPQDDLILENSLSVMQNSVIFDKSGVLDIYEEDGTTGKFSLTAKAEQAGDYPLTLVAQVSPPSFSGGQNLTASHVFIEGEYAYVSYNTVEDGYVGGIDIINVSDPNNPIVTSRLYYMNADINSLKYESGYIYAVGGVDAEISVRATSNSFVARIPVSNGKMDIDSGIVYGFQEGYNATDIATTDTAILVTSGREGFLTLYDKANIKATNEVPFADLRSVAVNNNTIAVLDAKTGVNILDLDLNVTKVIPIDSDFGENTKRALDFSGDNIVVAEGAKGAGVYNASTGTLIEYIPILINPDGVDQSDIVTNAVAINQEVMLMANGGAGLCLSEEQGNNTDLVGIIELEGSINYVASKGDYVFAAAGKEGLQIIKLNRPDQSLVSKCADLDAYQGSANLEVDKGDSVGYRGSKRFNKIDVSGTLLLCGSWTVNNEVNVDGLFEMNGTMVIGRNNKRKDLVVDKNATLRVEGNLTIFGDLVLKDGATVEFIGSSSVVNIFGDVEKSANVVVDGDFDDVQNKFQ
ncbi:MAG: hypothetical protein WBM83_06335 [Flavobacteriaceae bacterium]